MQIRQSVKRIRPYMPHKNIPAERHARRDKENLLNIYRLREVDRRA
jgi:hypothetical protein